MGKLILALVPSGGMEITSSPVIPHHLYQVGYQALGSSEQKSWLCSSLAATLPASYLVSTEKLTQFVRVTDKPTPRV